MPTNKNTQQINVFNKGMNTDTSDAYIPSDLYRYAENLRYVTNTGENTGELRVVEGRAARLGGEFRTGEVLIAVTSIRDYTIYLTNYDGKGRIKYINNTDTGFPSRPTGEVYAGDLWDTDIKYSLVTRWESEDNVKLYIADGKNELLSINIKGDKTYTSLNQLSDNIYINSSNISLEVTALNGQLKCPVVQYYYYLYDTKSHRSDISVGSKILRIYAEEYDITQRYATLKGYKQEEYIHKSVEVTIKLPLTTYDRIRLFRLEYNSNEEPARVYLICDEELTNTNRTNFSYVDFGTFLLQESLEEFLSYIKYKIKPRYIESKDDYLFAANVIDSTDEVDNIFKNFTFDASTQVNVLTDVIYTFDEYGRLVGNDTVSKYGPSFMPGETYRFGIIFYTKDGRKSSVKYLCDYTIPGSYSDYIHIDSQDEVYIFNKIGLLFTINIPSDAEDDCAGYEIVRCKRTYNDSTVLFLGIVGATFGKANKSLRYPSDYMTLLKIITSMPIPGSLVYYNDMMNDILTFACPEIVYEYQDSKDIFEEYKDNIYLNTIKNYSIGARYDINQNNSMGTGKLLYGSTMNYGTVFTNNEGRDIIVTGALYQYSDTYNTYQYNDRDIHYNIKYIHPLNTTLQLYNSRKIQKYAFCESPKAESFNLDEVINIGNDTTIVGTKEYINWYAACFFLTGQFDPDPQIEIDLYGSSVKLHLLDDDRNGRFAIASGKTCALLDVKNFPLYDIDVRNFNNAGDKPILPMTVANIELQHVVPYGGNSESAKSTNVYWSFGDYTTSDKTFIEVYSGDVFGNMFIYNSAHAYTSDRYYGFMTPTVYVVPVFSRIDLCGRYGTLYPDIINIPNNSKFAFLDYAGKYYDLVQDKDAYLYNNAYDYDKSSVSYVPRYLDKLTKTNTDTRIHYSEVKTNGELMDSWTLFKPMNFLDVDSRYGKITDLRLFKNQLIFWQTGATGVLSVNERTIIQDSLNLNIILGNGDTLQRFDYITTKYGMKDNQLCDEQSNSTLYWWDGYNRDIIAYSGGLEVAPLKKIKNVSNYINSSVDNQNPVLLYDNKYNELLASVVGEYPITYSEIIQAFTSVYTYKFDKCVHLNDKAIMYDIDKGYVWNNAANIQMPLLKYIINDNPTLVKIYDNVLFGVSDSFFYDSFFNGDSPYTNLISLPLTFTFKTKGQESSIMLNMTNREYDMRFAVPRDDNKLYGGRMRGRTMQCELTINDPTLDSAKNFSIQYIITKYRISLS